MIFIPIISERGLNHTEYSEVPAKKLTLFEINAFNEGIELKPWLI